ncbi:unnamed protein product [Rhizoctonia solani]|uniref:Proteasome subunit beta type-4 n=1 Tax=Rhizoctonia solani TaxID=456999 RepID=A0A8H3HC63_9AGAM|nr:unnamed protein product [Rhizoctonia solani]
MDHFPTNWGRPRNDAVDPYGTYPLHARPQPLFTTCIMDHFPTNWGRPRNDAVDPYGTYPLHARPQPKQDAFADGVQRTLQPIVTGTSVLGIRFKDGVMLAADNLASYGSLARFKDIRRLHPSFILPLASYGSLARFKDIRRLHPVGNYTVIGAGGDMSDFQYLQHLLDNLMIEESNEEDGHDLGPREIYEYLSRVMYARRSKFNPLWNSEESNEEDGHDLGPREIYEYLSRVMYARRSKFNPLWNSMIVGGYKDEQSFLGYVDLLGTTYSASTIATGYGSMIAIPLLRKAVEGRETTMTEEEGKALLTECMKVLFYRDARSLNKFQIATITGEGVKISESIEAETEWAFADKIRGYGAQTQ